MGNQSFVIGITGGTGCGKTTLLNCIAEKGGLVLDCDAIYHRLLQTEAAPAQKPAPVKRIRKPRQKVAKNEESA